jgi:heme/copper-type cytochrome/quinol oxidase subunit 2
MTKTIASLAATLTPVLASAQAGEQSDPGRLWWMWVAVSVVLLAGLVAIFASGDRARASDRERARRIIQARDEAEQH